jgi:hypothetical protein
MYKYSLKDIPLDFIFMRSLSITNIGCEKQGDIAIGKESPIISTLQR